ncbi:MAG: NAD-dependent epimerase/dehydratase family protein [Acidimicrobiales bacterium]
MTDNAATTVTVTGATGYIARHVVTQLLDAGFSVRGTARAATSLEPLRNDLRPFAADPGSLERLTIAPADLTSDNGWAQAMEGSTYVIHVASPIPAAPPKDPDELIVPARDGTRRVLRAARDAGVLRVVLTSSLAAVLYGVDRKGKVFTEADWSNPDDGRIGAYERSKTIAERDAWTFVDTEGGGLEMSAINPGLVLGPLLGPVASTSNEAVAKLLNRDFPACPDFTYSMVDARDVAAAHIAAMTSPDAAGQRYVCGLDSRSLRDVAAILAHEYRPKGYRVPTGNLPNMVVRLIAKFDKVAALAMNDLSNPQRVDASKVVALLGRPLRSLEEMTLATAASMIEYGMVKPPRR